MTGKRKTVRKGFAYRNCDDFAAYLNHMARQGWHFKEWRAGLVFEQGEPEDAVYCVEVFSGGSEYDTRPEPQTEEFAEYCEAAGWKLIDARRKFVVFKRVREDAVPIMTDEERFENIAKAESPDIWRTFSLPLAWCGMKLFEFSSSFEYRIFSNVDLFFMIFWAVLLLLAVLHCAAFLLWKFRCRRRIREEKPLFFGRGRQNFSGKWYSILRNALLVAALGFFFLMGQSVTVLILLAIAAAMWLMGYLIARFRPDADTNAAIQVLFSGVLIVFLLASTPFLNQTGNLGFYDEIEPPLTYADMGIDLELTEIRYAREQESIFGNKRYANLDYGDEYLFYSIYHTEYDWVMDQLWEEETQGKSNEIREYCTDSWGALEAFRNGGGAYLVRYEADLWIISVSLENSLTQGQIDSIITALGED